MKNKYKLRKNVFCIIKLFNIRKDFFSIILQYDDENIILLSYNYFGEYDGIMICPIRIIRNIEYNDSYLRFLKKICKKKYFPTYDFKSKNDFIIYAIDNNRLVGIVNAIDETIDFVFIKILAYDNTYILYNQFDMENYILMKKVKKLKLSKVKIVKIDSKLLNIIEKR